MILFCGFIFFNVSCVGPAVSTDAKNPPYQDQVSKGASSMGLMMNLINLATGHLNTASQLAIN